MHCDRISTSKNWRISLNKPYLIFPDFQTFRPLGFLLAVGCYRRKDMFLCSYSCTSEHWKVNILRNKRWTVRKHFPRALQKYFKEDKRNSLHLAQKHFRIFVLRYYLLLKPLTFPRASLGNFSHLGTDNFRTATETKNNAHIFAPNGDYCLFRISQIAGHAYCLLRPYTYISA